MEYTTNYQLPTWVETDRIQMDDFNDMTEKIDTALGEQSETLAEHTEAIAAKGDCEFYYTAYQGEGSASKSITFPKLPRFLIVLGNSRIIMTTYGATNGVCCGANGIHSSLNVSWSGNTVSWTTDSMYYSCNGTGYTYCLLALLQA